MVNCPTVGLHRNIVVMINTAVYHIQAIKSNNNEMKRIQRLCLGITDIILK